MASSKRTKKAVQQKPHLEVFTDPKKIYFLLKGRNTVRVWVVTNSIPEATNTAWYDMVIAKLKAGNNYTFFLPDNDLWYILRGNLVRRAGTEICKHLSGVLVPTIIWKFLSCFPGVILLHRKAGDPLGWYEMAGEDSSSSCFLPMSTEAAKECRYSLGCILNTLKHSGGLAPCKEAIVLH